MMDSIIRKFERFIKRNNEQLNHYKELKSCGKLSNHGYYDFGYLQGKIYAYENVLDDLLLMVEEKKKEQINKVLDEMTGTKGGK